MVTAYLRKSTNSNKKYMVTVIGGDRKKTIHFGSSNYSDYTKHKDKDRMEMYISRHRSRENWKKSGMYTAGFWSRWLLWSKPSITGAIRNIKTKFNITIVRGNPRS